ncbi:MAG: UDP-2,3-diacylglucosamine diphosphatase LpxI [Rhodobacteraceae bacterium]|nr:UDP-2,3-diacylglucosamine diphosphatase LpxI [Paracoccaceae bacterium]
MAGPVGVIAGRGQLPVHLCRALAAQGRAVLLAEMDGFPVENPDGLPLIRFRVEKLGALFKELRKSGVDELVFAGAVARPRLDPTKFDLKTVTLAPKFVAAMKGGDDGTLRAVLNIFEGEGFIIRAAHDLAPELLPGAGIPTRVQPTERDRKDTARAARIVAALAAADVGQGAVVAQGVALAVEAAPGTDRMLAYVADSAGACRPDPAGAGGVFFKGPKPGQDRRVDLPVIGPQTVDAAARAGLAGLAIEAGGVMVLDLPETLARADAAGLFLWVRPPEERP